MPSQTASAEVVELTPEVELKLLQGFRDLVAERTGYHIGRKLTQEEMSKATKTEREAVRDIREEITGDNLIAIITESNIEAYNDALKRLKSARKVVTKKAKPFRAKIAPLAKAVKYIDNVAIPDALRELGTPVQPRFSLSKWVKDAIETAKQK